jgi:hypothetical protein
MHGTDLSLLTPLLAVPAAAGLACLVARARRTMAAIGVLAFGGTLLLGGRLLQQVVAGGAVTE